LLQQDPSVVNWGCQLMQVVLYNGRKTVVVVVVVVVAAAAAMTNVFISVKTVCELSLSELQYICIAQCMTWCAVRPSVCYTLLLSQNS